MPYVNSDGTVSASPPFQKRATDIFWGIINFFSLFFRTLINPALNGQGQQYESSYRRPGGGPPPPPQRRFGGFKTLSDCKSPMPGGG